MDITEVLFFLQDISHILASIFKDVYTNDIIGKDTVSSVSKTKAGQSSYHEKYVEELQKVNTQRLYASGLYEKIIETVVFLSFSTPQAHSDYQLCIQEADMVENHIIQARAQAAAKERRAFEKIRENIGDFSDYQDAFTGKI